MDNYNNGNQGFELDWGSEIENDSPDFIVLPEGEYDFTVKCFERGRYNGGDKVGPCPKAMLTLSIDTPQGEALVNKDLLLHSKLEGLLCEFFTCIGQRKHGQRVSMNWNAVTGAHGRCKIGHRTYNGNQYNEVKKFLEPKQGAQAPQYQQPQQYAGAPQNTPPAPPQSPAGGGWQGGKF